MSMASANATYISGGVCPLIHTRQPYLQPFSSSSNAQAELIFNLRFNLQIHHYGRPDLHNIFTQRRQMRFDLHIFRDQVRARRLIAPVLYTVIVNPFFGFLNLNDLLDRIIQQGVELANSVPLFNIHLVYPLYFEILGTFEEHVISHNIAEDEVVIMDALRESAVNYNYGEDEVVIMDALRESALNPNYGEDEVIMDALRESAVNYNYGMIPTKESSIKNMLKTVKIRSGGENCTVCLEELEVGSDASMLPCDHTFHGVCIKRWLKQSHYCPVCRFEMPTN